MLMLMLLLPVYQFFRSMLVLLEEEITDSVLQSNLI